jgi:hypothetical protein
MSQPRDFRSRYLARTLSVEITHMHYKTTRRNGPEVAAGGRTGLCGQVSRACLTSSLPVVVIASHSRKLISLLLSGSAAVLQAIKESRTSFARSVAAQRQHSQYGVQGRRMAFQEMVWMHMDGWVVTRIIISSWLDLVSVVTSAVVVQLKLLLHGCTAARALVSHSPLSWSGLPLPSMIVANVAASC